MSKIKYKPGDLVAEYMTDESIYLILLTEVNGNLGHGYMVDGIHWEDYWKSKGVDEIINTKDDGDDGDIYPIELNEAILIEEGNTL